MESSVILVPSLLGLYEVGWCGRSADEAAAGVVETARDRPVDDVVADLDPDATEDGGVDDQVEVDRTAVLARRARRPGGRARPRAARARPGPSRRPGSGPRRRPSGTRPAPHRPCGRCRPSDCLTRLDGGGQRLAGEQVVDQARLVGVRTGRVGERVAQRRLLLDDLGEREQLVGQRDRPRPPAAAHQRHDAEVLESVSEVARGPPSDDSRPRAAVRGPARDTLPPKTWSTRPGRASAATEASVTKRRSAPSPRRVRGDREEVTTDLRGDVRRAGDEGLQLTGQRGDGVGRGSAEVRGHLS